VTGHQERGQLLCGRSVCHATGPKDYAWKNRPTSYGGKVWIDSSQSGGEICAVVRPDLASAVKAATKGPRPSGGQSMPMAGDSPRPLQIASRMVAPCQLRIFCHRNPASCAPMNIIFREITLTGVCLNASGCASIDPENACGLQRTGWLHSEGRMHAAVGGHPRFSKNQGAVAIAARGERNGKSSWLPNARR